MDQRRYSIFVSSTFRDLSDHRNSVIEEINKAGHLPVCMEFFGADHRKNHEFIKQKIVESDVFAIIVGTNLGQDISDGESFVEFEYDVAVRAGKIIIRFVCETADISNIEPKSKLIQFRQKILNDPNIASMFSMKSADSLAKTFGSSLSAVVSEIEKEERPGWIRSEKYDRISKLRHLSWELTKSPITVPIIDAIENHSTFVRRSLDDRDEKRDMARFFWRMAFAGIFDDSSVRNIYFEAGSSTAYLARRLVELFNKYPHYAAAIKDDVRFATNCMFTYLDAKLQPVGSRLPFASFEMLPNAPFAPDYAEAFGPIQDTISISATSFTRNEFELRNDAKLAVDSTRLLLDDFLDGEQGVAFMSFTGITISDEGYSGGVVNSYKNGLFKQAVMQTSAAKVLVVDGSKWANHFDPETQYPTNIGSINWDEFLTKHAVCFIFSTKIPNKAAEIEQYFRLRGFHKPLVFEADGNTIIVMFNQPFKHRSVII